MRVGRVALQREHCYPGYGGQPPRAGVQHLYHHHFQVVLQVTLLEYLPVRPCCLRYGPKKGTIPRQGQSCPSIIC